MNQKYLFLAPVGEYVWIMVVEAKSRGDALAKMLRGEWEPHSYYKGTTATGAIELVASTKPSSLLKKYLTQ